MYDDDFDARIEDERDFGMDEGAEFYGDDREDYFRDDVEADADALANCGWGTDEDYGYYAEDQFLDGMYEE